MVREDSEVEYATQHNCRQLPIDLTNNLLICNVKKDNWEQYLDGSAKIYYTGKKFPTTVALNKLYYIKVAALATGRKVRKTRTKMTSAWCSK